MKTINKKSKDSRWHWSRFKVSFYVWEQTEYTAKDMIVTYLSNPIKMNDLKENFEDLIKVEDE